MVVKLILTLDISAESDFSACICVFFLFFFSAGRLCSSEHIPSKTSAEKFLFNDDSLNITEARRLLDLCVYVDI